MPCDLSQTVPRHTQKRRRSVPANQGREVHQHGSDSGDEGELPGLSPTELEMLSKPTAETDNHGQEQSDGAQDDLLPDDMQALSACGDDMSVTED